MPHTRALYREFPGRPTISFGPPNSEMHFTSLSISASTLRTRFAVFRTLLFSSSFEVELTLPCDYDFVKNKWGLRKDYFMMTFRLLLSLLQ